MTGQRKPGAGTLSWILTAVFISLIMMSRPPELSAAESCAVQALGLRAARARGDIGKAADSFAQAQRARVCSGTQLEFLARDVAFTYYRLAFSPIAKGDQRERLLVEALKFARPWQLLAALGDIEKQRKAYAAATRYYQQALDDINDRVFNKRPPATATIAAIHKSAEISRMLAGSYIRATVNKSGQPGGLGAFGYRGFKVRKTPVPVQFVTNESDFTEQGRRAVADILDYLTKQGSPAIRLTGHTDSRGSKADNQMLSKRRAESVKNYLLANNYRGAIEAAGKGETVPFQLDDPGAYSQTERLQLDRRVELELLQK